MGNLPHCQYHTYLALYVIFSRCQFNSTCDEPEHVDASQAGVHLVIRRKGSRTGHSLLDRMSNVSHSEIIVTQVADCADAVRIGFDHYSGTAVYLVGGIVIKHYQTIDISDLQASR